MAKFTKLDLEIENLELEIENQKLNIRRIENRIKNIILDHEEQVARQSESKNKLEERLKIMKEELQEKLKEKENN